MSAVRKTEVLLAAAVGFVLGSRSGRGTYESLEDRARQFAGRPQVQAAKDVVSDKAEATVDAAKDKAHAAKDTVEEKLGTSRGASTH
jgi:hypothetical protein